jgi:hypothetical protein
VTIDPALAERLRAVLQRRADAWAVRDAELREAFGDDWPGGETAFPVELADLSAEELARLTVDVLWPPTQEEREARARDLMARAYEEVVGQKQNPEGA